MGSSNSAFQVETANGLSGLRTIRDAWERLYSVTPNRAFYNDWRWHEAIAEHLIPEGLIYLQIFRDRELIAILPLQGWTQTRAGLPIQVVGFPRNPHVILSDILVDRDHVDPSVLDAALGFLRRQSGIPWQRAWFRGFAAHSNFYAMTRSQAPGPRRIGESFYLPIDSHDAVASEISKKQLRNIRRLEHRAAALHGTLTVDVFGTPDNIIDGLYQFTEAKRGGWKEHRDHATAIRLNRELMGFYSQLLRSFAATAQARVTILKRNDDPIAGQIALVSNARLHLLKIGYKELYSDIAPGHLLLKRLIEMETTRFRALSLLTAPRWARRWHFAAEPVYAFERYNDGFRSGALRLATSLTRTLQSIKRRLSGSGAASASEDES